MHTTKLFVAFLSVVLLAGAGCSTPSASPVVDSTPSVSGYQGNWERTAVLVDGEIYDDGSVASLSLDSSSFTNIIDNCTYTGTVEPTDKTLSLTMEESNCDILEGYETTVFNYTVSDSGDELVTSLEFYGSVLDSKYSRIK
ncbi:hypothetical protein HQ487_01575 [Candidatus Uhrbacteria bacterium]|nr:hypothetical protein [Candidatus Uhrbacteria bacterium]